MRTRSIVAAYVVAAALAVGGVVGCASGVDRGEAGPATPAATVQAKGMEPNHGIYYERLKDGYLLTCEYADRGYGGGTSCDWPGHQAWVEKRQK